MRSDDYVDYDSDEGVKVTNESSRAVSDPYAGVHPVRLFSLLYLNAGQVYSFRRTDEKK